MKNIFLLLLLTLLYSSACKKSATKQEVEALYQQALEDFPQFSKNIAGDSNSDFQRTKNIITWFAEHFEWKATDYKKRTASEIIERKGGNCNELAIVSKACMHELGINYRTVREINLHIDTPHRQATAEEKVKAGGNQMSVFGRRHNDHVWIEVYDSDSDQWYPADPSLGVVGKREWLAARYGFGQRFSLDPSSEDMIAPFAILILDRDRNLVENRSIHYAVDGFNELYDGKLSSLPSWPKWERGIRELSAKAVAAFGAEINLHDYTEEIRELWETYFALREEYQKQ